MKLRVCRRRWRHESCCVRRAGRPAPHGAPCWKGSARPRQTMRGRGTGRMDGKCARRESSTLTSTSARCCLTCRPALNEALLRSRAGPQAGAWLAAIPTEPATTFPPPARQIVLRRRLRQPLPLHSNTCGPPNGCEGAVDGFGDHALACPRTGPLAKRATIVERAWVRVAREAMGSEGQVVPQQVVGPHHRPACRNAGPSQARPRRVRGAEQWGSAVLRRHACVPPCDRGTHSLRSGCGRRRAARGRAPQTCRIPRTRARSTASSTMPPQLARVACHCGPSEGPRRGSCSWAQRLAALWA